MFITAHNVVHYLLERGFISSADVVHNRCVVSNSSSRNRCFKVAFEDELGVFVKQARPDDPITQACLEIEATCGREFQRDETLAEHVPAVLGYDQQRGILCSTLIADGENSRTFQKAHPDSRPLIATLLGDTLAKFHSPIGSELVRRFPQKSRHRIPSTLRDDLSGATAKIDPAGISSRIREHPEYVKLIRSTSSLWCPGDLCHGDIRWDNILVSKKNDDLKLRIIDWELAGGGDSAWDVAGVVQSYLIDWVASLLSLDELRDLVKRFWIAYQSRVGDVGSDPLFLRRVTAFAGCRLVQSTFEQHQFGSPLGELGHQLLQLSWNLLQDPESTERELLQVSELFLGSVA